MVTSPPERRSSAWLREMPGSSMRRSVSAPAADPGHRPGQGVRRACPPRPRGRRRAAAGGRDRGGRLGGGGPGDGRAAHLEAAGRQLVVALEVDRDRADEGVALLVGVLADHRGELGAQGLGVDAEPLVVVLPSATVKALGTIVRPRATMAARSSHSRWSALAISTGCTSALKARAKGRLTISSIRRSKRCRTPTSPPRAGLPARAGRSGAGSGAGWSGTVGLVVAVGWARPRDRSRARCRPLFPGRPPLVPPAPAHEGS